jgi:hypothetical protein
LAVTGGRGADPGADSSLPLPHPERMEREKRRRRDQIKKGISTFGNKRRLWNLGVLFKTVPQGLPFFKIKNLVKPETI